MYEVLRVACVATSRQEFITVSTLVRDARYYTLLYEFGDMGPGSNFSRVGQIHRRIQDFLRGVQFPPKLTTFLAVALLGWVTPGAATEGVTPLFFLKTPIFFLYFPEKPGDRFFLLIAVTITVAFYWFHSGVTPSRVLPHTFFTCPTSFLHSLFFVNLPTQFFPSGVTPWRVSHGAVPQ